MRDEIRKKISAISSGNVINLRDSSITDEEMQEIIDVIEKEQPNVQSILLSNNQIADLGAELIGKGFSKLNQLSYLDLQFNAITINGVDKLFAIFRSLPNLEIALFGNFNLNVDEVAQIAEKFQTRPTMNSF